MWPNCRGFECWMKVLLMATTVLYWLNHLAINQQPWNTEGYSYLGQRQGEPIDFMTCVQRIVLLQIGSVRRHKGTFLQPSFPLLDINNFNGWLCLCLQDFVRGWSWAADCQSQIVGAPLSVMRFVIAGKRGDFLRLRYKTRSCSIERGVLWRGLWWRWDRKMGTGDGVNEKNQQLRKWTWNTHFAINVFVLYCD